MSEDPNLENEANEPEKSKRARKDGSHPHGRGGGSTRIDTLRGESGGPLAIPEPTAEGEEAKAVKQHRKERKAVGNRKADLRRKGRFEEAENVDEDSWLAQYTDKTVGLAQAELAFLAGIVCEKQLARVAGTSVEVIVEYIPQFKKARNRMLKQLPSSPLTIAVSKGSLAKHSKDTTFLRTQVDKLKGDLDNLGSLEDTGEKILALAISQGGFDSGDIEPLTNLLGRMTKISDQRIKILAAWTKAQAEWQKHIGYAATHDSAAQALKSEQIERAKHRVRKEMEASEGSKDLNSGAGASFDI